MARKIASRLKGKNGELEVAKFLREHGYEARRGQQYAGGTDSPDVVCPELEGIHIEVKRTEQGNPYLWLAQAQRDAKAKVPTVWHRRNKQDWIVILTAEDFLNLFLTRGL